MDPIEWLMRGAFVVGGAGVGLVFKLAYDGIRGNSKTATAMPAPSTNGNGKVTHKELIEALGKNRCGAHEHMSNGVTEMIIQQKTNAGVLSEIRDNMKDGFDETFGRLLGVENRMGKVEGAVAVLNERTKNS